MRPRVARFSYALATGIAERRDGKWRFKRDRRFRQMPVYSDGQRVVITVHNGKRRAEVERNFVKKTAADYDKGNGEPDDSN